MQKLIAIAVLVSLVVLVGCDQDRSVSSARVSAESASATSAHVSEASSDVVETPGAVSGSSSTEARALFLIDVGGAQLTVKPADTEAARALMDHLQAGPVKVSLHAYGGFEQVGSLPWDLPANDEQITTVPGDVMLYQGNQVTIFIGSNSWAYTPLGSIEGATPDMLFNAFGGDAVEVTLLLG